jgi:hypothetical protein
VLVSRARGAMVGVGSARNSQQTHDHEVRRFGEGSTAISLPEDDFDCRRGSRRIEVVDGLAERCGRSAHPAGNGSTSAAAFPSLLPERRSSSCHR